MATKSAFSIVGLAHKLCLSAEALGYTPELLNTLAEHPTLLGDLLQVQLGYAEVKMLEHPIDCDADPFLPSGWKVEEHQKGGQVQFNASKVELWLANSQKDGKIIGGVKLRKELAHKPVLNANVLDYLLAHPHLIPEEWKRESIFFWGTIYRDSDGNLYVRCLYWRGGRWDWDYDWLESDWNGVHPAALARK